MHAAYQRYCGQISVRILRFRVCQPSYVGWGGGGDGGTVRCVFPARSLPAGLVACACCGIQVLSPTGQHIVPHASDTVVVVDLVQVCVPPVATPLRTLSGDTEVCRAFGLLELWLLGRLGTLAT